MAHLLVTKTLKDSIMKDSNGKKIIPFNTQSKILIYSNVLVVLKKHSKEAPIINVWGETALCFLIDRQVTLHSPYYFKSFHYLSALFPEFYKYYKGVDSYYYPFWWPLNSEGLAMRIEVVKTIIQNLKSK